MKFGFSRTAQSSTVAGVLPGFLAGRIEPRRSRRWLFFGALTLVAFIYGCAVAIFPTLFYSIFAIPIIGLGLAALWALPDTNVDRGRAIRSLFWLYLVSLMLWPSYLAIALPGLPWINVQRLFLLPLCAIFFYSLSTSKVVRTELGEVLSANRFASTLFFAFVVLQFATTVLSPSIGASINKLFINQCAWTVPFLISCWMFRTEKHRRHWYAALLILVLLTAIEALVEYKMHKVPWRDHIPSFLGESEDYVQANLRRATGLYRTKGFTVNTLVLAELLGVTAPFVFHAAFTSKKALARLFWILYLPCHFFVIVTTDSRLGMVSFLASGLLYLGVWNLLRWRERKHDPFAPALVLAYPLGAAALGVLTLTWTRLYRMVFGGGANSASDIARQTQWKMMWPKLWSWPFGHGPNTSGHTLGYIDATGLLTVDSYYITVLLEYGIAGFVIFYSLFLLTAGQLTRGVLQGPTRKPSLAVPVAISMIVFVIDKSVLSLQNNHSIIFMALGMAFALRYRMNSEPATAASPRGSVKSAFVRPITA